MRIEGVTQAKLVHNLVLEAFIGERPPGCEALHKNDNQADASLGNLSWGTSQDNANDRVSRDRQQRLVIQYEEIVEVEDVGPKRCYDLAVAGPWHNFVADGFVVHNSYNEMSARYVPLPDVNYIPSVERLMINSKTNKQAGTIKGAEELTEEKAERFRTRLVGMYESQERLYQDALLGGVPKELARVHLPVGRYSRMRASANLRNWLAFLTLRMAETAQWEIRQYANAVGNLVAEKFPRTWELFSEGKK
jgi:thymidylate synthase (FAD)